MTHPCLQGTRAIAKTAAGRARFIEGCGRRKPSLGGRLGSGLIYEFITQVPYLFFASRLASDVTAGLF